MLQEEFQHIFKVISLEDPYTTVHESTADPDIIQDSRFDIYPST